MVRRSATGARRSPRWPGTEASRPEEKHIVQRSIEILIGRLITDEDFRRSFMRNPHATLEHAVELGLEVTPGEMLALLATDTALWDRVANQVDARLQKASLTDN
jgi:hypothetical protein